MRLIPALLACALAAPSTTPAHLGEPAGAARSQDLPAAPPVAEKAPENLAELLAPIRAAHGLPALGALVLRGDGVVASGVDGLRRIGGEAPVTLDDRWHLGSCTKSMTATLAAILVARGKIAWSTTVGEVLEDLPLHDSWRAVTLEQLLSNSAGAPANLDFDGLWRQLWEREGTPTDQRRLLARGCLGRPTESEPGTAYLYSNAGFSIAGAMLEEVAAKPFEELLTAELFQPLGMARAGFGAPGDPEAESPTDPLGHRLNRGQLLPVELGLGDDNPPGIAPAGRVHAPLRDWARYASLHLNAARGRALDPALSAAWPGLAPSAIAALHRPRVDGYAMGWIASEPDWCDGPLLWHNGSNTMWYCELALFPAEDLAVLVVANTAHGTTRNAVGELVRSLHTSFSGE